MSSKEDTEKRDEMASNADTGYDTGSVTSASNSSQITKVRQRADQWVLRKKNDLPVVLRASSLTETHTCTHTPTVVN